MAGGNKIGEIDEEEARFLNQRLKHPGGEND